VTKPSPWEHDRPENAPRFVIQHAEPSFPRKLVLVPPWGQADRGWESRAEQVIPDLGLLVQLTPACAGCWLLVTGRWGLDADFLKFDIWYFQFFVICHFFSFLPVIRSFFLAFRG